MRKAVALLAALLVATSAAAQLPGLRKRAPQPAQPALSGIDALRADFLMRSGADTVYFGQDSALLAVPAKATLAAQAQWLLQHPEIVVRIEGQADPGDTRDHALAMGARRARKSVPTWSCSGSRRRSSASPLGGRSGPEWAAS